MHMFENLKLKRVIKNFHTKTGIQLTIKPIPLPKEVEKLAEKLYFMSQERPERAIPQLEKTIAEYPDIPSFKNHLYNAYELIGKRKKAELLLEEIIEKHPKYIFGIANKIVNIHDKKTMLQHGFLLGNPRNIKTIIGDEEPIHYESYINYQFAAAQYEAIIGETDSAEDRLNELIELRAEDTIIELVAHTLALDSIKKIAEIGKSLQENNISVESIPKIAILQSTTIPQFSNELLNTFYEVSTNNISNKKIAEIFNLPKHSLISDLHLIIKDSIQRWEYFSSMGFDDDTHEFVWHALYFTGALGAKESLRPVLDLLRMGEGFVEYWFSDYRDEVFIPTLFSLGKDQLDILQEVVLEEYNDGFDRALIASTVAQVAFHYPERKSEVEEWFTSVLQYHLDHPDNKGIIDTDFLNIAVNELTKIRATALLPIIEHLFNKGWIDDQYSGDFESIKNEMQNPFPFHYKKPFPENIQEYYNKAYEKREIPIPQAEREKIKAEFEDLNSPAKQAIMKQLAVIMEGFENESFGADDDEYFDVSNVHLFGDRDEEEYEPTYQEPLKREGPKIGRNAPCPCGSGKKYKHCCIKK